MTKFITLKKTLSRLQILPSWTIFLLDLIVLSITSGVSYFLFNSLNIDFSQVFSFQTRFSIILLVFAIYLLLFKTYKGIIRYSTLTDIGKIFNAVFFGFITLVSIDLNYYYYYDKHIFVVFTLFYTSIFIFFSLIGYRIFIKLLFQKFLKTDVNVEKENIVIIGVNSTTISLVETLNSNSSPFRLISFIDTNTNLNGKKIAGINIISFTKKPIITYLRWKNIKNVI